jgi:hypothetical protein
MKSYTLRPDTFTLNFNVLFQVLLQETGAAILLQSVFRCNRAKKDLIDRRAARAAREAAAQAAAQAAADAAEMSNAAVSVQCAFRGKLAKKKMAMAREAHEQELSQAATAIQSRFRVKGARRRFRNAKTEKEKEEACALMLQCAWRGKTASRAAGQLRAKRIRLQEEGAALKLQCAYRSRKARAQLASKMGGILQAIAVVLVRAEGLRAADKSGTSDPHCLVRSRGNTACCGLTLMWGNGGYGGGGGGGGGRVLFCF